MHLEGTPASPELPLFIAWGVAGWSGVLRALRCWPQSLLSTILALSSAGGFPGPVPEVESGERQQGSPQGGVAGKHHPTCQTGPDCRHPR